MKKNILYAILSFAFCRTIQAQTADYKAYYQMTSQAYCALADSNFLQAAELYEKAFADF